MDSALTGISASQMRLNVSAHNIANISTPGYKAKRVIQSQQANGAGTSTHIVNTDKPVSLANEVPELKMAIRYAQANNAVIQTYQEMQDTLLNIFA